MIDIFIASNGIQVDEYGEIVFSEAGCTRKQAHEARIEFYQHLRDEELGRWRDPADPHMVVYPANAGFEDYWVVDEKYPPKYKPWTREQVARGAYSSVFGYGTAKRYFDAHPETKHWHGAQPGEAWLVTVEDEEPEPMLVRGRKIYGEARRFVANEIYDLLVTDPRISHAEKIYPKDEDTLAAIRHARKPR